MPGTLLAAVLLVLPVWLVAPLTVYQMESSALVPSCCSKGIHPERSPQKAMRAAS